MKRVAEIHAVALSALVLAVALAASGTLAQGGNAPPAGASTQGVEMGSCSMSKVKFKTSDVFALTTSTSYVDVPDMDLTFTVSGNTGTCVEVLFSGEVATEGEGMRVRAILDGVTRSIPNNVLFADQAAFFGSHAFHFAFKSVAPGTHTLKVQWRSQAGGEIYIDTRSLFVHYQ